MKAKTKRAAKEIRILVITIAVAALINIVNIEGSGTDRSLTMFDSLLIALIPVVSLRVYRVARNRVGMNNPWGVDSWPIQPGENSDSPKVKPPRRVTEIEAMVNMSSLDPEYFESTLAEQLRNAFGAEDATAPALERGGGFFRRILFKRGPIRRRNIKKMRSYISELKRGSDGTG